MDFTAYRTEFPTLERKTYLNSCSLGALSNRVRDALTQFQEDWTEWGASAWYEKWVGEIQGLRGKVARLLNARPEEIAWAPSASVALASLTSAIRHNERKEVVVTDLEFPTLPQQWMVRPDAELKWVHSTDGIRVAPAQYDRAVGENTRMVATSRVFYATGYKQNVKEITRIAHAAGALSLVDDYQGTGQVPIDVKDVGCDVLVTGSLKWLCGGPGSCFMYVRRELIPELTPTVTGWWGNAHMFDFELKKHRFWDDARRFEMGEVALPGVFASSAALDLIHEVGVHRIETRIQELVQDLTDRLHDAKLEVRSPEQTRERTGIVMVGHPDAKGAVKRLADRGIIVDDRPGKVRVSPHFYNTEEENERVVEALKGTL